MREAYVKPYVTMEMFTPNTVVALCEPDTNYTFDCLYGPNKDTAEVLSKALTGTACNWDCGFTAIDNDGDPTIGSGMTEALVQVGGKTSSNHSKDNPYLDWSEYNKDGNWTVGINDKATSPFLGWLYVGLSGNDKNYSYYRDKDTGSNHTASVLANGILSIASGATHFLLTAVFGTNGSDFRKS